MVSPTKSKFNACPTVVDGFRFASRAEAREYGVLLLRGRAGEIRNLELQPRFPLHAPPIVPFAPLEQVAAYVADFRYEEKQPDGTWHDVVSDVKGVKTAVYRRSARHMLAEYGITIREVRR